MNVVPLFTGITGTISLSLYSFFSANLIGIVYKNTSDNRVRISHIDFWGRRKNDDCNVNDILSDPIELKYGVYLPVTLSSSAKQYKLLPFYGEVTNSQVFSEIFGEF